MVDGGDTGRFVGRDAELATFGRAIDAARRERPSLLLVGGDAGIGKSTLVQEAGRRAGAAVFLGRAVHVGGDALPLAPLFDLVRQVGRSARSDVFDRPELAALASSGRDLPAGGVFVPVLDLFGALGADDVVVAGFEDLHWADAVTWELFEFVARNLVDERVVLVGTYRADEVGRDSLQRRRLAELTRVPGAQRIHMAGLGRDDVAIRVAALVGGTPPAGLVDEVLARGDGNPFFTEELVAAHLQGEALPPVLSDLLAADLDARSPLARHVLSAAAVVGRDAPHELLAAVTAQPEDAVERGLHEALDNQMLVLDRDTGHYRFRHPLIGEIVYDALLPSESRRLHARVAEWLQTGRRGSATDPDADADAQLALHLDRAGEHRAAFQAWLRAADAAEHLATAAAAAHLDRALALWDESLPSSEHIRRMWQAAELHNAAGNNERAIELARAALDLGEPPKGQAWGYERLGRFLWGIGRLEESTAVYDHAAELLQSGAEHKGHLPAVYAGLAQADAMLCRFPTAERWGEQALDALAAGADDPVARVTALRVLGIVRSQRRDFDEGVTLCQEAVGVAEQASLPAHVRLLAVIYLVISLMDAGRYDEAVTTALDGAAEAQRAGLSHAAYLAAQAADTLIRMGRWAEADTVLRSHAAPDAFPIASVRLGVAASLLAARRGDASAADAALSRIRETPVDTLHSSFRTSGMAEVAFALGRWQDAIAAAVTAAEAPGEAGPLAASRLFMIVASATVEDVLDGRARRQPVDAGPSTDRLSRLRADAAADVRTAEDRAAIAHAEAAIGLLGEPDPHAWAGAAQAWRDAGDPWLAALAGMHLAETAAATGRAADAADALREAHQTAVALGAAGLAERIEAVAKRTRISIEAPVPASLDADAVQRLGLTGREAEVLELVAAGLTNREIGERLFVSEKTASVHVSNILRKLGVASRVEAAAVAQRAGIA